jgi:hypothetical protein
MKLFIFAVNVFESISVIKSTVIDDLVLLKQIKSIVIIFFENFFG